MDYSDDRFYDNFGPDIYVKPDELQVIVMMRHVKNNQVHQGTPHRHLFEMSMNVTGIDKHHLAECFLTH